MRFDPTLYDDKSQLAAKPWTTPYDPDGAKVDVTSLEHVALVAGLSRPERYFSPASSWRSIV